MEKVAHSARCARSVCNEDIYVSIVTPINADCEDVNVPVLLAVTTLYEIVFLVMTIINVRAFFARG